MKYLSLISLLVLVLGYYIIPKFVTPGPGHLGEVDVLLALAAYQIVIVTALVVLLFRVKADDHPALPLDTRKTIKRKAKHVWLAIGLVLLVGFSLCTGAPSMMY